jgi:hypothetical protein
MEAEPVLLVLSTDIPTPTGMVRGFGFSDHCSMEQRLGPGRERRKTKLSSTHEVDRKRSEESVRMNPVVVLLALQLG